MFQNEENLDWILRKLINFFTRVFKLQTVLPGNKEFIFKLFIAIYMHFLRN